MKDENRKVTELRQLPHSANLRLHRWTDASATFFITKSLHPKKPVLDAEARAIVVSALRFAVQNNRIYLSASVVMPDHWHALFALREPWTLPKFMHDMISRISELSPTVGCM
jgi:REP element-mobilizing transposase RayT